MNSLKKEEKVVGVNIAASATRTKEHQHVEAILKHSVVEAFIAGVH